jgi:hypothetical protein
MVLKALLGSAGVGRPVEVALRRRSSRVGAPRTIAVSCTREGIYRLPLKESMNSMHDVYYNHISTSKYFPLISAEHMPGEPSEPPREIQG